MCLSVISKSHLLGGLGPLGAVESRRKDVWLVSCCSHLQVLKLHTQPFVQWVSGVKWPGRGVDHPPPSSAEVKERVEQYLYFPSGPSWPLLGRTLPMYFKCEVVCPEDGEQQDFRNLGTQKLKNTASYPRRPWSGRLTSLWVQISGCWSSTTHSVLSVLVLVRV